MYTAADYDLGGLSVLEGFSSPVDTLPVCPPHDILSPLELHRGLNRRVMIYEDRIPPDRWRADAVSTRIRAT